MALTRAQAAAQVAAEYPEWFAVLGVGVGDVAGQLGGAVDDALRAIGVAAANRPTAAVADADADRVLAALRLFALRRLRRAASARSVKSLSAGGTSTTFVDLAEKIDEEIALAAADLAAFDYALSFGDSWQAVGSVSTNYLEPAWPVA